MNKTASVLLAVAAFFAVVSAECPNACSAHGKCGAYDMCQCFRNWMANDCSERICPFGLAHVDTPKGDLDSSSGALSGPDTVVVPNSAMYPYGTTEQYPSVTDIDGNVLTNTAHEYRECSNKGLCDRATGTCTCFEGYEGAACQRASCPSNGNGVCSGHGTCETIAEIAARDFGNIYKLWDESLTMGCACDGGYTGPDCSQRKCKYGIDPYYKDNNATARYSNFTVEFFTASSSAVVGGNYSLIFVDSYGEDWTTKPIPFTADCRGIVNALEGLPNNVIPNNTVRCFKHTVDLTNDHGISMYIKNKYTVAFPENPGKLPQLRINKFLDGSRPTLYTDEATSSLGWHIFSDGFIGEDVDQVNDRCFDVEVTIDTDATPANGLRLASLDANEAKLLKRCLGDSNGNPNDNVDVYNWDHGNAMQNGVLTNPHLIKLQEATQYKMHYRTDANGLPDFDPVLQQMPKSTLCDKSTNNHPRRFTADANGFCANHDAPGFFAVLYFDGTYFRILSSPNLNVVYDSATPFWIYTTQGHLQLVSSHASVYTAQSTWANAIKAKHYYTSVLHSKEIGSTYNGYTGDISCERNGAGRNGALDCLNKNDQVMVFAGDRSATSHAANPIFPNIYSVKKIGFINRPEATEFPTTDSTRQEIILDYALNTQFVQGDAASSIAHVYKFYPPRNADGGYRYAAPCSGRGVCNQENGLCECFAGFTDDNCNCINALAV